MLVTKIILVFTVRRPSRNPVFILHSNKNLSLKSNSEIAAAEGKLIGHLKISSVKYVHFIMLKKLLFKNKLF